MIRPNRRHFIVGGAAAVAGATSAVKTRVVFGDPADQFNNELIVMVFLRGGMDGLSLVLPVGGSDRGHYEAARSYLAVPTTGADAALPLDGFLGLNPKAAPLHDLYQSGHLGVVVAAGLNEANRSHFESMEFIERGTPGVSHTPTGWLARHLASASNLPSEITMPSISVGSVQATSLLGNFETINISDPGQFNLQVGPWEWRNAQRVALRHLYSQDSTWLHQAGVQTLDAVDIVELNAGGNYQPGNGAVYPSGSFGEHLQVIAQMTKLDLGLRVATIDLGGWDTHEGQGDNGQGYFGGQIEDLAEGLKALYTDLDGNGASNYSSRMTVVVQSEFGRRLRENNDRGTDHGHGNMMLVMGGNVNGGVHGQWPGLSNEELFEGADLAVTTDFRRVLSEVLIRRMGNNKLGVVFPGYSDYQPLGVVSGPDMQPDYSADGSTLFSNGFETGDTSLWSSTSG